MASRKLRSINKQKAAQVLAKLAHEHLIDNPNAIIDTGNTISVFGIYTIVKHPEDFTVYKNFVAQVVFNSAKHALSWCIFDKYRLLDFKNKILECDKQLGYKQMEIVHFVNCIKGSTDSFQKGVLFDRLYNSRSQAVGIKKQLDKCVNLAKYWQQKGFENETSRLGIK